MKDDLFQKNTRKYDIFFRPSEKKVFSKRAAHYLSCIIWKDGIFFPKTRYFFLGQGASDAPPPPPLPKKDMEVGYFLCTRVGATNLVSHTPAKKNQGWPYPAKIRLKVIGILD